jgi:thioredoxin
MFSIYIRHLKNINMIKLKITLLAAMLVSILACNSALTQNSEVLTVTDFQTEIGKEAVPQIVDVRTPEEYTEGHLARAINLDYNGDSFQSEIEKLDKSKPTFVYCLSGGRSAKAAEIMRKNGFVKVYEMKGGMLAWRNAKLPVETTAGSISENENGMTADDFKKITTDSVIVLVDFNAEWCGPCKKLAPILDELALENKSKLKLVKIDIDKNQTIAQQMQIQAIPVIQLYKGGFKVWEQMGLSDKATIEKAIAEFK